jgi:glycerophosphoryl diester phosphodiesterase
MQTFSLETCVAVRRLLPNLSIYLLVAVKQNSESGIWTPTFSDIIAWAVGGGLNGIGVNDTCLLNREAVEAVHAAGLKLNIWTIDDPQAARRLIELGVDGLITNRPGWLRSALGI